VNVVVVFEILFINYNFFAIPLLSIIAWMVIQAASLPGKIEDDKIKELLNFGGSLRISGLIYMVTAVSYRTQQALVQSYSMTALGDIMLVQNFMILIYILTVIIFSLILRNCAYDSDDIMKTKWIFISDIVGIGMLLLAIYLPTA